LTVPCAILLSIFLDLAPPPLFPAVEMRSLYPCRSMGVSAGTENVMEV
jgi:hypothetical protein